MPRQTFRSYVPRPKTPPPPPPPKPLDLEGDSTLVLQSIQSSSTRFVKQTDDKAAEMAKQSVGLVNRDAFQRIRESVEMGSTKNNHGSNHERDSAEDGGNKKRKATGNKKSLLSFEDEEGEAEEELTLKSTTQHEAKTKRKKMVIRDPTVDTSFLETAADKSSQQQQYGLKDKQQIQVEMKQKEEEVKQQPLSLSALYMGKTAMPAIIQCKRGNTIAEFLELARSEFKQHIGEVPVSELMYVKDGMILPHDLTFHELIVTKARGKSGPLLTAEAPLTNKAVNDSQVTKVLERSYYEKHKHESSMVRWELYDASKDYGRYLSMAK